MKPSSEISEYKDPNEAVIWLRAALTAERKKYEAVPEPNDLSVDYIVSSVWGTVFVAYRLIEVGFKLVAGVGQSPKKIWKVHSLVELFDGDPKEEGCVSLTLEDRQALEYHYDDYCRSRPEGHPFGIQSLKGFLETLDGVANQRGWMDWAYFLIQNLKGRNLPKVDVKAMHTIVEACWWRIEAIRKGYPVGYGSPSWLAHFRRWQPGGKLKRYLTAQINSNVDKHGEVDGWAKFAKEDRVVILMGPDYVGRYEYVICQGGQIKGPGWASLPQETPELPHDDRRQEVEDF